MFAQEMFAQEMFAQEMFASPSAPHHPYPTIHTSHVISLQMRCGLGQLAVADRNEKTATMEISKPKPSCPPQQRRRAKCWRFVLLVMEVVLYALVGAESVRCMPPWK